MAFCDADYCITDANIESRGRMSEGGVFFKSKLSQHMEMGTINFPPDDVITNTNKVLPYVIVGDNAFFLKNQIMVPYPGIHDRGSSTRIYDYTDCPEHELLKMSLELWHRYFAFLEHLFCSIQKRQM